MSEATPNQVRLMDPVEHRRFDLAFRCVLEVLDSVDLEMKDAPTLYANLISMTICKLAPNEAKANELLEVLIGDLRQLIPLHFAEVQIRTAANAAEQIARKH